MIIILEDLYFTQVLFELTTCTFNDYISEGNFFYYFLLFFYYFLHFCVSFSSILHTLNVLKGSRNVKSGNGKQP